MMALFQDIWRGEPTLDANPTSAHRNSILHWKNAISSFMPNLTWDKDLCQQLWESNPGKGT